MNKTEFLFMLERRLIMLNDTERDDLINEYTQHIDMKVASGLSEEEAIADFGDPEELIKELLDAYNLNTNYDPTRTDSNEPHTNKKVHKQQAITKINRTWSSFCSGAKQKLENTKKQYTIKKNNKPEAPSKREAVSHALEHITVPHISIGACCTKIISWCKALVRFCLKLSAFCVLLCAGACALTLLASSAAMLVFVITGYAIVGPFFIVLGCTLLSLVVTGMLMQYVFGIGGANA